MLTTITLFANDLVSTQSMSYGTGYEIVYTSTDGKIVNPASRDDSFDANIVSNTYENGVGTITFDGPVTNIGIYAFYACATLSSITIPKTVTKIGEYTFYNCTSLTKSNYNGDVAGWCAIEFESSYGNPIYYSHNLYINNQEVQDLVIPNTVTTINNYQFSNCASITSLTIPNSVTCIRDAAFSSCSSLSSIQIGTNVDTIEYYAFRNCGAINTITCNAVTPPVLGNRVFNDNLNNVTCVVPCASVELYRESAWANHINNFESEFLYEFTILSADEMMGTCAITQEPDCNTSAIFKAIPQNRYHFVQWSDGNTDNPRTLRVTDHTTLFAEFAADFKVEDCQIIYTSTDGKQVIPAEANAFGNATIVSNVYTNGKGVITFNTLIETIGETAFANCKNLKSIVIPNYVTDIEAQAFLNCSNLTDVTIPNGVETIGRAAFNNCSSLRTITIPQSVKYIYNAAFVGCSLNSIYVNRTTPPTLNPSREDPYMVLGTTAVATCYIPCGKLASYQASEWKTKGQVREFVEKAPYTLTLKSSNDAQGNATITEAVDCNTLNATITATPNTGYHFVQWSDGNTDNPRTLTVSQDMELTAEFEKDVDPTWQITYTSINGNTITPTKTDVFGANIVSNVYENGVGTITFDGPVTSIGEDAFFRSSLLTSIIIPDRVINIGYHAFYECSSLTSVIISNSVKSIGNGAFFGCSSLLSITIPDSVTSIGESAFDACLGLEVIVVENENTTYDSRNSCNAIIETATNVLVTGCKKTIIPNTVMSIGESAFRNCNLMTSITIPNSVTSIGEEAFAYCYNLNSVTIGNSVTNIGRHAFRYCSMMFITIPNSVTSIGEGAFSYCRQLTSVKIGNSVTNLDASAFSNCSQLSSIISLAPIPPEVMDTSAFTNVVKTIPIYVPCGSVEAYKSADGWNAFTNIQEPLPQFIISVSSQSNEMGEANVDRNTYCEGVQISATAYDGYHFVQWSDGNTDNPRTLTVSQDMELTAEFEKDVDPTWQIKYTSTDGNIVTPTNEDDFGVNIVSNTYKNGVGTITFDGPVTTVGYFVFNQSTTLQTVVLPNTVNYIGEAAFQLCSSLTSINIPNGVTNIEHHAFAGCSSLTDITLPNSVSSLGDHAFYSCSSLRSVELSENMTTIEGWTFSLCTSLSSITIPNSIMTVEQYAFNETAWYNNHNDGLVYANDYVLYNYKGEASANTQLEIREGTKVISSHAFYGKKNIVSVVLPNSITTIGTYAFDGCSSLASINIPDEITTIGSVAFRNTALTSIRLPESITYVGYYAFKDCAALDTIYLESSTPPGMSSEAFTNTSVSTCVIPCGTLAAYETSVWANYMGEFVEDCPIDVYYELNGGIVSSELPTNITSPFTLPIPTREGFVFVGWYDNAAGEGTAITILPIAYKGTLYVKWIDTTWQIQYTSTDGNIVTPNKTDVFGANIVSNTYENGVGTITFDAPITKIGDEAFYNRKKLASITIPKSVETIGQYAFWDCKALTNVTISNGVMKIGGEAFRGCSSLTSVFIPSSVTSIGTNPFGACPSISSIVVDENNPKYDSRNNCNGIIETANNRLISGCQNTIIPYGVTNIDHAFWNCSSLKQITIPNTVTNIGTYTFSQCSLTSIVIPKSVTSIGDAAFINCPLSTIVVEEGNPKYDSRNHCNAIIITSTNTLLAGSDNTIIPEGITAISPNAFRGRKHIASIAIPNSVTRIGEYAFEGCTSLTSITIPDGVTAIKTFTFSSCDALTSVIIGKGVNSFEQGAFFNSPVETVYFNAQEPAIGLELVTGYRYFSTSPTCYIPCGTLTAYEASVWNDYMESFIETYEYTLTLSSSDNSMGSATITQEPACGIPAIIVATPNDGYLFSQWSDGNTDNPRTLSVNEDIKLTAQWTPNTNTPYVVKHLRQALDGTYPEALIESDNLTGTTAANVTPVVKTYSGFTSPATKTATIAADGSTVVEYYYTRNKYTLTWSTDGDALTGAYSKGSVLFEAAITIPNTPTKTGYTFAGWDNTVPETMPATDKTFTATWTPNTNTPYVVKHYRQALDGTYPSALMETENLTGTTATNVTPLVKTYTGFTSPATKTATIAADGSTVVEYYYTRNQYTLTWVTDGNALTGVYSKGSVLFEAAITIPNTPTKMGYTFVGWDNTVPVTMPAEDVTLIALFTIHTYSVILTADQNGTVSGGGTYNYGESVTITATPNDGYTFSQWSDGNTDNPRTFTVTEDIELTAEFEEEGNYGSYTRTVRIGYNTICLPHGSSHFTGATFYEIAHILKNDKKIFFDEAKTLEAGKPYIFYPHSTEVTIYYDNTTSAIPLSHNGLHGTFDGITAASNFLKGKYLVAGDKMVLCGDGCSLAANRAYIVLDEISDKDHPAIPGIKRVSMDYSEANETTALDNITDESVVAPMQEGVYDILGRKVDAPTVSGFYIINGKKVFVMEK